MNLNHPIQKLKRLLPLLFAAAVLGTGSVSGMVPPVFHSSFKAASDAAAADQSLVLLVFSAEWCGPCKLLKSKTLSAPEFQEQDSPLHIADVDIDAEQKMAHDFGIEAVPTLILLTPDGKIVSRQTGFLEIGGLMEWLRTGREHAAAGQWEGTVPGAEFNAFIKQTSTGELGTNEIQRLIDYLGDPDPANREKAGEVLLEQREKVVPPLIEAVGNAYLGERIAAAELLQRLAPDIGALDPWQSRSETSNTVVALRRWWAKTGELPVVAALPTNSLSAGSLNEALDELRGDDPARRTSAMTTLVGAGQNALPAVREAIKRAERSGDQRALGLLEDVRWTIIVPDAVEQQSGGVRAVLARGKSSERQSATERLGGMGHDALGVLVELAGDADPLVVESAIHALSSVSGGSSIPALATLLNSPDSNLRMTAAQALGHTKNPDAVKPLLGAVSDSDEVVACTALSALEENQARESYNRVLKKLPPELAEGLRRGMVDPRWRVRAAAAEVAGKLSASNLTDDLNKLLRDSDGFVARSALTALEAVNAQPPSTELLALGKRLPSLQGDTVAALLQNESNETVKTVTDLFTSGTTETRVAILGAFLRRGYSGYGNQDEGWKPMLSQAIAAPDTRLRHTAAEVLSRRSPAVAAQLVGPLLTDEDPEIRQIAANTVLQILGKNKQARQIVFVSSVDSSAAPEDKKPVATAAQIAEWHKALLQCTNSAVELNLAAALFITGDGKDLSVLLASLDTADAGAAPSQSDEGDDLSAIQAIMPKLSLPGSLPILRKLQSSPARYAQAVKQAKNCKPEVADYLLAPARFKSALDSPDEGVVSAALELIAGYDYEYDENRGWSLWSESDQVKAIAMTLLDATNAGWRAAAVFSLGLRNDAEDNLGIFEKAIADPNPWIRHSAAQALARTAKDRPTLEHYLAPLLSDTNSTVASIAATGLLEPETRSAAGLDSDFDDFQFESVRGGRTDSRSSTDDRPLAVLENKPAFLASARKWAADSGGQDSSVFALLLAQYGDFGGLDRLVVQAGDLSATKDEDLTKVILAGIALSRDTKYLPALQQMAAAKRDEAALRQILRAMKGMTGAEARQLRLNINEKIRNAASAPANE